MNRLCPTFLSVGVSYQPAGLTFSRRNHQPPPPPSAPFHPRPGQHRGDVVGVADSISTHVLDKSLGLPRPRKNSFPRSRRFVPLGKQSRIATPMPNRQRPHAHTHIHTYVHTCTWLLCSIIVCSSLSAVVDRRSIGHYHNPRHVALYIRDVANSRRIRYRVVRWGLTAKLKRRQRPCGVSSIGVIIKLFESLLASKLQPNLLAGC